MKLHFKLSKNQIIYEPIMQPSVKTSFRYSVLLPKFLNLTWKQIKLKSLGKYE